MYILLDACQHPGILRIIYFGSLLLDIVFTLVPIGLIVILMIDFSKAVIGGDEKAVKSTKIVGKRIIYAMIVFCIPWIVEVFMSLMDSVGFSVNYQECLSNAKSGDFSYFDSLLEKEEKNNNTTTNNKITYENAGTKVIASGLITVLNGQLGNNNNDKKYGFSTDAWCAQFTTWALKQVSVQGQTLYSYINAAGPINDNSASGMWPAFRSGANSNITFEYSKAYGGSYTPKAGDIIFYQWTNGECRSSYGNWDKVRKCSDHVGIVTSSDSSNVYTIEGNTGEPGLVRKRTKNINSDEIVAYGSWYKYR